MDELNKDEEILKHLDEHFSCKICDGVLICAKGIDCGHKFCTYCLELLQSTTQQCPTCDAPITSAAVNAPDIDRAIDNLLLSCSPEIQKKHELAKHSRSQKIQERADEFKELKKNLPHNSGGAKSAQNLDEVCTNVASNIANASSPSPSGSGRLKSIRPPYKPKPFENINGKTSKAWADSSKPQVKSKPALKSKTGLQGTEISKMFGSSNEEAGALEVVGTELAGIDLIKVEALFNMYDVFLKSEAEKGGWGDMSCPSDATALANPSAIIKQLSLNSELKQESAEILRLRKKHKTEVEALLKEAEGALKLDEFVKKWSEELRKVVGEAKVDQPKANDSLEAATVSEPLEGQEGIVEEVDQEKEMWKASAELIRRFRESRHSTRPRHPKETRNFVNKPEIPLFLDDADTDTKHDSGSTTQTDYDMELDELMQSSSEKNPDMPPSEKLDEDNPTGNIDSINLTEMGETIIDENFEFLMKIKDCKQALNKLKDDKLTNPAAIRDLIQTPERKTRVPPTLPCPSQSSTTTPRVPRTRKPITVDPVSTSTPGRPPQTATRPSTSATSTPRKTTLPSIPNAFREKSRPSSAILKKRPPFQ